MDGEELLPVPPDILDVYRNRIPVPYVYLLAEVLDMSCSCPDSAPEYLFPLEFDRDDGFLGTSSKDVAVSVAILNRVSYHEYLVLRD